VTTEGPLEAIVLAAGAGVRFGRAKLTSPWGGGALIDGALAAALAAPARSVWLVTGADPAVAPAATAFSATRGEADRLILIHAAGHAEGMAASLRAGLAALPPDAAGVFVFLGDMPRIPREIAPRLAAALGGGIVAAAPVFAGRRGHPVLFARALFAELAALAGDTGARDLLDALGPRLALIEAPDDGVLFDVDTQPGAGRGRAVFRPRPDLST
jgi:molybdenum cofactor cytidylyltransferase